jgi:hypothetical protein
VGSQPPQQLPIPQPNPVVQSIAPSSVQQPTQPTQQTQPQDQQPTRLHAYGAAVKKVLGDIYNRREETRIDPDTGREYQVVAPQKPGGIFRSILTAAILGGAAAEEAHDRNHALGLAGGLVVGGGAGIQDQRNRALQQRQQAVEEYNRVQEKREEDRAAQSEHELHQTQMLHLNAQQMQLSQAYDFAGYDHLVHAAQDGQALVNDATRNGGEVISGILPGEQKARKLEDIPYDLGMQYLQAHPELLHEYHLALTGHRTGAVDSQTGRPYDIPLYTLYKAAPEGPLSPEVIKMYTDLDPRLKPSLTPDRVFSAKEREQLYALYLENKASALKAHTSETLNRDRDAQATERHQLGEAALIRAERPAKGAGAGARKLYERQAAAIDSFREERENGKSLADAYAALSTDDAKLVHDQATKSYSKNVAEYNALEKKKTEGFGSDAQFPADSPDKARYEELAGIIHTQRDHEEAFQKRQGLLGRPAQPPSKRQQAAQVRAGNWFKTSDGHTVQAKTDNEALALTQSGAIPTNVPVRTFVNPKNPAERFSTSDPVKAAEALRRGATEVTQ